MTTRTRNIQLNFRVTEEERDFIHLKMKEANIPNREAYLRKMAIDGTILTSNFEETKKLIFEINKIGININQIAHIANTDDEITKEAILEIKEMMNELWQLQKSGLLSKRSS
ncbi:plasmid mobilization protein [Listeria grandensis]|uniref:plasmid mobilization protein n=1 Tax=Listeria grandensis TaxID=1494963 RepID=UPI00164E06AF|nr:plasmid mobilization relaxosome protein MobC [Listeria grandensis]MBC6314036.1 MobC family plasmid mobilization relaxosome protein [Listeria grandensis]